MGIYDVVNEIVIADTINDSFSLIAWVHGNPAILFINLWSLHEGPDGTTHHWDRLLIGHYQNLTNWINLYSFAEKLT